MKKIKRKVFLSHHPEIKDILRKEYGIEGELSGNNLVFNVVINGENFTIVVGNSEFLGQILFDCGIYKFMKGLKIEKISSLILINPKTCDDPGFLEEIESLIEITFKELKLPESEELVIIPSIKEINLNRSDYYLCKTSEK